MGGLDLETDEDENVRVWYFRPLTLSTERALQGIDGPIVLTGFTPDLDDFTIRVVDGRLPPFAYVTCLNKCL